MSEYVVTVNDENYDHEVGRSIMPVLAEVWAEWAAPSKLLHPTVDSIASEYVAALKVVRVNIDEARDFAMEYNVSAVPTFLLIKNGELVATTGALHSEEELLKFIQPMLS